jgi:amino acid transporter
MAWYLGFDRGADLNNAAVFAQYVPTCIAVIVLRRTRGPSSFALPFGPLIPILATLGCFLFLNGIGRDDALFALGTLALGLALHALWRFTRKPVSS